MTLLRAVPLDPILHGPHLYELSVFVAIHALLHTQAWLTRSCLGGRFAYHYALALIAWAVVLLSSSPLYYAAILFGIAGLIAAENRCARE